MSPGRNNFVPHPIRVSQLNHYRIDNPVPTVPKHKPKRVTFREVIRETFYDYAEMTKVNGMYYLQRNVTSGIPRLLWIVLLATSLCLGVVLVFLLWKKYVDSPTRMTVAPEMAVLQVPFPAVTICHPQSVMDYRAEKLVDKLKLPLGATRETVLESLPALGYFNEHQWSFPRMQNLQLIDNLLIMNNLTVEEAIQELGMTCKDLIVVCYWARKRFPCFGNDTFLNWTDSTSHYGACCSFNYHPIVQKSMIPFAVNTYGIHGGLSVIGTGFPEASDGKSGALYSEGLMLMIHHPHDFAVEGAPLTLLGLGSETFISVSPTDSRCSEQVMLLPQTQRSCIIGKDFPTPIENYRQPTCMLECLRDEIHRKCGCHPYHLPSQSQIPGRTKQIRKCAVEDSMCLIDNYYMFQRIQCDCLPACGDVTYKTSSVVSDFAAHKFSMNKFYSETNLTKSEFIFHVYLNNQLVPANRRVVVVSWISLLANLGGVFSLCLGMSVLSLFEIFFYVFFRFYRIFQKLKSEKEGVIFVTSITEQQFHEKRMKQFG
ncbi:sodium channel protein Nach-like [Sabethes cyaneus]|uniref:sodium channel protein Nach-like n=1 Tax=Sabethes cyaneus TaxID=53552 RepID=UPI00237DC0C1|nr:sodium channel protein Nach-like [Sabethes cyaneus]